MSAKETCPPRGRPRAFCLEQAVERAMRLFAARGYDAVGVAELSEELGIKPPSLYAAFGSKRGLFERTLELYGERFGRELPKVLDSEARLEDAIGSLFNAAADAYTADPETRGCMVIAELTACQDRDARDALSRAQEALRQMILERIERHGAAEPELLADYAVTVLRGMSTSARLGVERERLRQVAQIAARGAEFALTSS